MFNFFCAVFLDVLIYQVLQNNAKYQVVPKKLTIGKRLAQCLHPALPGGVHRKALETYEIIFKIIGPKRLAKDLFLYRYCILNSSIPNAQLRSFCFPAFYISSITLLYSKNQFLSVMLLLLVQYFSSEYCIMEDRQIT